MVAIQARQVAKAYRIYANPKDRLKEFLCRGRRIYHQPFWALRDVSFDMKAGSTVGLIGDNGAGKSTLLQLVAGVLRPTSGQVATHGRVSTILELGTGFNPEFTGRENAMMSGTILGIRPREMERRLPEIADFAEIGDFFDRPVKIYSSGMYVRLAFAVATSVDPDILIIDEALAVGDQYFQKRCFDRIQSFRKAGKSIFFCSHDLYYIGMICDEVIWLRGGQIEQAGEVSRVVSAYENYLRQRELPHVAHAPSADRDTTSPWIEGVRLAKDDDPSDTCDRVMTGDDVTITVAFRVPRPPTPVQIGIVISRNDGVQCFGTGTHVARMRTPDESGQVRLHIPRMPLMSGEYVIAVFLLDENGLHIYDRRLTECRFRVTQKLQAMGLCYFDHWWEIQSPAVLSQPIPQPVEPART